VISVAHSLNTTDRSANIVSRVKSFTASQSAVIKAILVVMVVICLLNAYLHDPYVGYDAVDFISYIKVLSQGRLPGIERTHEFFTPPLPFLVPASLIRLSNLPPGLVLKLTQLLNVALALGSALILLKIMDLLIPGDDRSKEFALGFLLMLPVFYKTHAFVRPEPYVLFFTLLSTLQLLEIWKKHSPSIRQFLTSGLSLGLLMLSRQWGALMLPAVVVFALLLINDHREEWAHYFKFFTLSALTAFAVCSWFYLSLAFRYGSLISFNRTAAATFSFSHQPADFYFGSGNGEVFSDPIRDSFDNQAFPILYSETWGDYWEYFIVYGEDSLTNAPVYGGLLQHALEDGFAPSWLETNRFEISGYLGRVNLVSLPVTAFAILSLLWGGLKSLRRPDHGKRVSLQIPVAFLTTIIVSSILGYFWFLIRYPSPDGDTIKATYMIQIFPFVGALIGLVGSKLHKEYRWTSPVAMLVMLATFVHNIGCVLTRYLT
jgi:4-amino-4-deoxy-L-arabinose transferase-like glycosyltransferase